MLGVQRFYKYKYMYTKLLMFKDLPNKTITTFMSLETVGNTSSTSTTKISVNESMQAESQQKKDYR